MGDFNMNCLKYHDNAKISIFTITFLLKSAISIINYPTRISQHSTSLGNIDNGYSYYFKEIHL